MCSVDGCSSPANLPINRVVRNALVHKIGVTTNFFRRL
jgi:hypothetical protein